MKSIITVTLLFLFTQISYSQNYFCKPKGYFSFWEFGAGLGSLQVKTVHGYKFSNRFYLGAGLGFEAFHYSFSQMSGMQVPLFLRIETDFQKKAFTPYLESEIGYAFFLPSRYNYSAIKTENTLIYVSNTPAFVGSLGVGVKLFTNSKVHFKLTPQVLWRVGAVQTSYLYDCLPDEKIKLGGTFGLKLGVGF